MSASESGEAQPTFQHASFDYKAAPVPLSQSYPDAGPELPRKLNFIPSAARHNKAGGGITSMSRGGDKNAAQQAFGFYA